MSENIGQRIRTWIESDEPGLIETKESPQECLRMAWAQSGIECSATEFADALWSVGFKPDKVGPFWRLNLPGKTNRTRRHLQLVR